MTATPSMSNGIDLDNIYLIWLDAKVDEETQKHFCSIIHQFKAFENIEECENYIRDKSYYDRIFLIVSGQLGHQIVPRIYQLRQVCSIYVYCQEKQRNKKWARKFTKVKCVAIELKSLINQIQSDYSKHISHKIDGAFPITIYSSDNVSNDYYHSQLIIDTLLQMKTITADKDELIKICSNTYSNDNNTLSIIHEFEQNYHSNQALWWYTRESFLCRLLNKALSIKNLDLLFFCGFFLRDMQKLIEKNQCNASIQVYHGQLISNDELSTLRNSVGHCISINTFLSAIFNRKQIILSLNKFLIQEDLVRVLFEIDAITSADKSKAFAIITQFTYLPVEKQVLFMLGSVFQLVDICLDSKNNLWIAKIVLVNIKKDYDETNLISCGHLLRQMKKFDDAEKYFSRLLKEIPEDHEDFSQCYQALGLICFQKTNYELSLYWYSQVINLLKSNDPNLASTYYSIGCIYQKCDDYNQALENYNDALSIWKESYGDNKPIEMAECLNNMGCIYEKEEFYSLALQYHQAALSIRDKFQIDVGSTYNNIGNIYFWLGEYDVALESYLYSFEMKIKTLSLEDPSLGKTLANMGLVYEEDGNFEEALKAYKRAALIFENIFSSTRIYNIQIQEDIQRVTSLLKSKI
ncbi:unnamed protein product [Adineta steineri]|uniref:Uncharacterized protein n=1 Tax=Adineta steineri TaxID=433720 RepID=A0A818JTV7_9BILA|nr:unnamed protein product [Adineta steineri]